MLTFPPVPPVCLLPTQKPIVVFTAAEKLSKSEQLQMQQQQQLQEPHNQILLNQLETGSGNGKRNSRRMLGTGSPLITSQRLTNFSTITEEEDQHARTGGAFIKAIYVPQLISIYTLRYILRLGHIPEQSHTEQLSQIPIIAQASSDASTVRH